MLGEREGPFGSRPCAEKKLCYTIKPCKPCGLLRSHLCQPAELIVSLQHAPPVPSSPQTPYQHPHAARSPPPLQAVYTALKETETRATDLLPYWKYPLINLFVPRQRKAAAAVALIRCAAAASITACAVGWPSARRARGPELDVWYWQRCTSCLAVPAPLHSTPLHSHSHSLHCTPLHIPLPCAPRRRQGNHRGADRQVQGDGGRRGGGLLRGGLHQRFRPLGCGARTPYPTSSAPSAPCSSGTTSLTLPVPLRQTPPTLRHAPAKSLTPPSQHGLTAPLPVPSHPLPFHLRNHTQQAYLPTGCSAALPHRVSGGGGVGAAARRPPVYAGGWWVEGGNAAGQLQRAAFTFASGPELCAGAPASWVWHSCAMLVQQSARPPHRRWLQVAGHETTGSVLTWTVDLLARNPDKLKKVGRHPSGFYVPVLTRGRWAAEAPCPRLVERAAWEHPAAAHTLSRRGLQATLALTAALAPNHSAGPGGGGPGTGQPLQAHHGCAPPPTLPPSLSNPSLSACASKPSPSTVAPHG